MKVCIGSVDAGRRLGVWAGHLVFGVALWGSLGASAQSIVTEDGGSAGEEKNFVSSSTPNGTSVEACNGAKEKAQEWLKQNTEKTNYYYLMNQAKRGWVARSGGTTSCSCEKQSIGYTCSTTAKLLR